MGPEGAAVPPRRSARPTWSRDKTICADYDSLVAATPRDPANASRRLLAGGARLQPGAEDMVLTDLILRAKLPIGIFTLDTGRLHAETLAHARPGPRSATAMTIEAYRARARGGRRLRAAARPERVLRQRRACARSAARIRKVEPLSRALAGKRGMDHRPAPRAVGDPRRARRAGRRRGARHGQVQPARRLDRRRRVGLHPRQRRALQRRCTTAAIRRSAASRARARYSRARTCAPGAGGGRTRSRRNAACTSVDGKLDPHRNRST